MNNFVILLLVANLLMGIIIDKFGNLRDRIDEIKDDDRGYCFICGQEWDIIEKNGSSKG